MDFPDNPSRAELSRLVVAADPEVDRHRLVGHCCERAAGDAVSVSLLVPVDDESGARADGSAQEVRLVGHAATLLDAAGVRLEDVIVREDDGPELEELLRCGGIQRPACLRSAGEGPLSCAVARHPLGARARADGFPAPLTTRPAPRAG